MSDIPSRFGNDPQPVGPLGIIAMDGCKSLGEKVNSYLVKWEKEPENADQVLLTYPGYLRSNFLLDADCPRFSSGEGKAVIRQSVRGYDLYILCDVTNYSNTYRMYGMDVPMSPDDYFQDLKRIIAAEGKKAKRVSVIMPYLYEGRQHRRAARESLDCAMALQELTAMGIDNIITFDAHDPRVQNAIPRSGFENVHPTYQILKALLRKLPDLKIASAPTRALPTATSTTPRCWVWTWVCSTSAATTPSWSTAATPSSRTNTWANRSRARTCSLQTTSWPPAIPCSTLRVS